MTEQAESVGQGAKQFMATTLKARVVGAFEDGFYVANNGQLMAVVNSAIPAGPLYLRIGERFPPPALGAAVEVDRDDMVIGTMRITTACSPVYKPTVPYKIHRSPLLADLPTNSPEALAAQWPKITAGVEGGALVEVQQFLCGRGTGLTPEGDDVLAGLLVVLAGDPEGRAGSMQLARSAKTTDLSKAFLTWAAAGQSVEQVHDLLWAANRCDRVSFLAALERVRNIGGSTGNAMLCGMKLATVYRSEATPANCSA